MKKYWNSYTMDVPASTDHPKIDGQWELIDANGHYDTWRLGTTEEVGKQIDQHPDVNGWSAEAYRTLEYINWLAKAGLLT